jgi:hypothetical protein
LPERFLANTAAAEGVAIKSPRIASTLVLVAIALQSHPARAKSPWPQNRSYAARLELPHLERWSVDKTMIVLCLCGSRGNDISGSSSEGEQSIRQMYRVDPSQAPKNEREWMRAKMVLPLRIELRTSPLPRECSTTELRQRAWALIRSSSIGSYGTKCPEIGAILATGPWRAQAREDRVLSLHARR